MQLALPDADVRRDAIMTPDHAFVWASAGTGKTHTLTLRALYLLLNAPFIFENLGGWTGGCPLLYSTSLTDRLRAAHVTMRSLVLTTFTRKAAAEMHSRLYYYLDCVSAARSFDDLRSRQASAETDGVGDPLFLEIVQTVLQNLTGKTSREDRLLLDLADSQEQFERLRAGTRALANLAAELRISTIHSLAASILRRHPLHSGIPPSARFARESEDDMAGIEEQIVQRWWRREVLANTELQDQLGQLLKVLSMSEIRQWLKKSCQFPWIVEEAAVLPLESELETHRLVEACYALLGALEKVGSSRIEERLDHLKQFLDRIVVREAGAWRTFYVFIQQSQKTFFLDQSSSKMLQEAIRRLPPEHSCYFQSWTDFCIPAGGICVAREFGEIWKVWVKFLHRFVDWAQGASSRELGVTTFDEMIEFTVRLFEDYPEIRRAEQKGLRSILVDEFQDTDPQQLRLLRALLQRDAALDHEVIGYFVGDKKQSIYRFRGADVPSIVDFHERYEVHTGCLSTRRDFNLTTNFRSTRQITTFVNHFFDGPVLLSQEAERLFPVRQDDGITPEWIWIDSDENGDSFTADQARGYAAAETLRIIQEHIEGSASVNASYGDILVLVRDGREIDALLPLLHNAGIPAVSAGAKTFYRQPEVLDVLNLLIVLLHPQDQLATAAILRSPFICLSDPDIHELLREIPSERLFHSSDHLPDFIPEETRRQVETIRTLAVERPEKSLTDWLSEVRSFVPIALYAAPEDREGRAMVRIDRVIGDFAEGIQRGLVPPLTWLLKQRERSTRSDRWDSDAGEDVTLADESINAVRVMTIHKAKGLEGRLVVLHGWTSVLLDLKRPRGRHRRPETISLTTETGETLRAFSLTWAGLNLCSPSFGEALRQEAEGSRSEAKRLAYVATTRARDRLVLISPTSKRCQFPEEIQSLLEKARERINRSGREHVEIWSGALRLIKRRGRKPQSREVPPPSPEWRANDYERVWQDRYAEANRASDPILCHPSDPEHRQEAEVTEEDRPEWRCRRDSGLLTGRLVHAYLERHLLESYLVDEKLLALSSHLPELTSDNRAIEAARLLLSRFYSGKLADVSGRPYRKRVHQARVLGREIPFYAVLEEQAWNGVIDLVVREEGVIRGIDYKCTSFKSPLPESYSRQEHVYTEALRRLFPGSAIGFEFWWLGN